MNPPATSDNSRLKRYFAPVFCMLILGLIGADTASHPSPAQTRAYHEAVQSAGSLVPVRIGSWIGAEAESPPAPVAPYRRNLTFNRRYENIATGEAAAVLLVHCRDTRDMAGHFPPICYPANGWRSETRQPLDIEVGDLTIRGTEYQFSMMTFNRASSVVVYNFMVMPDGRIEPEVSAIYRAAAREPQRYYGAAQIQVVVDSAVSSTRRRQIYENLLQGYLPVIQAVRSADEPVGGFEQ